MKKEAVVIGLGHIGASLAARLSASGWKVWGCDADSKAIRHAHLKRWISGEYKPESVLGRDPVCVIATPETAVRRPRFERLLAALPKGTVVTDVFSSKGESTETLKRICRKHKLGYGWSHPLAGREGRGIQSADPAIFGGSTVLIDSRSPKRAVLARFWKGIGCKVEFVTTSEHQKRMAAGSHLMHVIAFTVASTVRRSNVSPSVLSATRVAKSNPKAWSEILCSNRREVKLALGRFERELSKIKSLLSAPSASKLEEYLSRANQARLKMEGR